MSIVKLAGVLGASALVAVLLAWGGPGGPALAQGSGSIAGYIFYDANQNGRQEPNEPGLEGWYLTLAKVVSLDFNEPLDFARTDWDGNYRFSNVEPGNYLVVIGPMPPTYANPQPAPGAELQNRVTLEAGQGVEEVNFRIALPGPTPAPPAAGASIEGYVFVDADGDAAMGEDEYRLFRWSLTLLTPAGEGVVVETGVDGRYSFSGLLPGTYRVRLNVGEVGGVQEGNVVWLFTFPDLYPGADVVREVVLAEGQAVSDASFGLRRLEGTGVIAGHVFEDANRNGVRDPGEPELYSGYVRLERIDPATGGFLPTYVGSDGYLFQGLPPGAYHLSTGAPELGESVQTVGPEGLIAMGEGEMRDGVDFGFARVLPASTPAQDVEDREGSPSEAGGASSSSDSALRWWQIAAAIVFAAATGGVLGAVFTARWRRARRPG